MADQHHSRRNALKLIGAGTTLAGTSAVAGAVSDDRRIDPSEAELPYPDTEYMTVGDDVKAAVGGKWWLLTLDRDRIDELLQKSTVGTDAVTTYSDRVTTLRDTYTVEETEVDSTRAGQRHTYHLTNDRVGSMDKEQKTEIAEVANAVFDGLDAEADAADKSRDVSGDWYAKMHRKQAEYILDEFDITYNNTLRKNTDDPDQFGCKDCSVNWLPVPLPNRVTGAIESALKALGDDSEAKHPPFHFYLGEPPTFDLVIDTFTPPKFGGAPGEANYMVQEATNTYNSRKAEYLGYASHYLQDMSVPFHSGAVLAQLNYSPTLFDPLNFNPRRDIHYAYEDEINNNIESAPYYVGDAFKEDFKTGYPYFVSGVADACKEMSSFAGEYGDSIFNAVLNGGKNKPWNWDDGGRSVFEQTHNCMSEVGGYMRGFLYDHYDYNW